MQLPTTDVTDYGNRPGDGPLRAGGQQADELPRKGEHLPSTPSRAVEKMAPALALVRDVSGGTETVRKAGQTYLPQAPGEDAASYRNRLERSVFHNFFRRTRDGLIGLIYRRDPVLGEDVPPQLAEHWENIDLCGTHGDVWLRDLTADAMEAGHAGILVEYPNVGERVLTRAEEAPLRPYWVPIRKDDILSWRTETIQGRLVLTQLVIRECQLVPAGEYGEKEVELYRVFYRRDGVVGWRLEYVTEDKKVVVYDEGTYPTQDEIPFVEVATSGRRGLLESDPPLLDLAYLNVAHYQQWSDYAYSLHKTCVPFVFVAGLSVDGEDFVVGANTSIISPNPQASAQYVSHDGAALGACKAALDDLKADMGTLGLAMLAPQKRAAETAEAKRLDKSTSDSALAVTARAVQDAVERALIFHARYLGLPEGGSVKINRDFEGLLMDAPVMSAYAQLVNAGFPGRLVLRALQEGGRIPEDEDLEALEMEMLAGQAAAAEAQAEAVAAGMAAGAEEVSA